jgi:hypothetical protein
MLAEAPAEGDAAIGRGLRFIQQYGLITYNRLARVESQHVYLLSRAGKPSAELLLGGSRNLANRLVNTEDSSVPALREIRFIS